MDIRALGYIGIDVSDTAAWRDYAGLLGTMVAPGVDGADFCMRLDDRPYRVMVRPSTGSEGLAFSGWELPDAPAVATAVAELEKAGCDVEEASAAECEARRVRGLVRTTDPGGFTVELFWGPVYDHELFVSPAGVSGFVTGDMGLGHIVIGTPELAESLRFYTDLLGFRVSDYMNGEAVVFLHCNPRHHSLALVGAPEPALYHFMIEARTVDDVGYTLDRHDAQGAPISLGLGRHPNDLMLSFYSRSPSGFDVEFGCGGRRVDDATWTVSEISKPSLWGHRRPAS